MCVCVCVCKGIIGSTSRHKFEWRHAKVVFVDLIHGGAGV